MPTFRNFSSDNTTTITAPTGTVNGDMLVVILRGTNSNPPAPPSADWTQLGSDITNAGGFEFGAYYAPYSATLALTYTSTGSPAFYCWGWQTGGTPVLLNSPTNQPSTFGASMTWSPARPSGDGLLYGVFGSGVMSGWVDPSGWTVDSDSTSGMRGHKSSNGTETSVSPSWTGGAAQAWCGFAIAVPSGVVEVDLTLASSGVATTASPLISPVQLALSPSGTSTATSQVRSRVLLLPVAAGVASDSFNLAGPPSVDVLADGQSTAHATASTTATLPSVIAHGSGIAFTQASTTALIQTLASGVAAFSLTLFAVSSREIGPAFGAGYLVRIGKFGGGIAT